MNGLDSTVERSASRGSCTVLQPGRPWPMGASVDGDGVNFAVFSAHASKLELCLFDNAGELETARLPLPGRSGDVWHGRLPGAAAGLVYGLRAHGPFDPANGHRFNGCKLLLDPWAREIVGRLEWSEIHRGNDRRDNARQALKARVVDDAFDWQDDRPPATPLAESVIYELHVRGFTRLLAQVEPGDRGSFAGLASEAAIAHLKRLGVTAVNLLPVHQSLDEERLVRMGLTNYWGYNTIGFFCPDPRLASTAKPRDEFRRMVRQLHRHGIEVLLDVVYNHTAESDESGPTLSWRGLDNASWYRLPPDDRSGYVNLSGCGNTVDVHHPPGLQLVLDSMRYWVEQMHVDGFRFDLAPVLGRVRSGAFDRDAPFFRALQQDPVLQRVKLIAEPWDVGTGGYQLGRFPEGWLEWNDKFRDAVRGFWLAGGVNAGEFAMRLAGSADLFGPRGRSPLESMNYLISHDGFTLADLVSHDRRHNEANGEHNRDGTDRNLSWNCGVEGVTDDPAINATRARLQRALLATLLLSQGTPMLAAGDELGHGQRGNNNPYCQDNVTTWIDWERGDRALIDFTAHLLALRRRLLLPRAGRWFSGVVDAHGRIDLTWLRADAKPMQAADWQADDSRVLGAFFGRSSIDPAALLLLFNADSADTDFKLPPGDWRVELDSSNGNGRGDSGTEEQHGVCVLPARSVLLLSDAQTAPDSASAPTIS